MAAAITLKNSERMELTQRANSRTGRAEDARRARVILLLAEGRTVERSDGASRVQSRIRGLLEYAIRARTHRRSLQPSPRTASQRADSES
jgi:hypothetical protein